jgi:hypothetical protein
MHMNLNQTTTDRRRFVRAAVYAARIRVFAARLTFIRRLRRVRSVGDLYCKLFYYFGFCFIL